MELIKEAYLTGERALFHGKDLDIQDCTFADGESPLKESENIKLTNSTFKWKYPLWYSKDIYCYDTTLMATARSGIWYTKNITMENCFIQAPKHLEDVKELHYTMYNYQMQKRLSGIVKILN